MYYSNVKYNLILLLIRFYLTLRDTKTGKIMNDVV